MPENERLVFDKKYFIGAKGRPNPEMTKKPRPEDHPLYDPEAVERLKKLQGDPNKKPVKVT